MERIHLFVRALTLLLSIVTGFFGGLLPHRANRYYTEDEITAFTAAAEAAYPKGMIIAIGGGFDSDETFRPLVERSLWEAYKEHVKHADPNGDRDIASIEVAARSIAALQDAQEAFAGVAEESGLQSEEDIIRMVSDIRKER